MFLLSPRFFVVCKEFLGVIREIVSVQGIWSSFQLDEPFDPSLGLPKLFLEVLLHAYPAKNRFVRI